MPHRAFPYPLILLEERHRGPRITDGTPVPWLLSQPVLAGAMLLMAIALISLAAVTGTASSLIYGFVFGIANAALHTHLTYVWPRFFGRKHLGAFKEWHRPSGW